MVIELGCAQCVELMCLVPAQGTVTCGSTIQPLGSKSAVEEYRASNKLEQEFYVLSTFLNGNQQ
jgi:hypothetical protein